MYCSEENPVYLFENWVCYI